MKSLQLNMHVTSPEESLEQVLRPEMLIARALLEFLGVGADLEPNSIFIFYLP